MFCPVENSRSFGDEFFRGLATRKLLQGLSREEFISQLTSFKVTLMLCIHGLTERTWTLRNLTVTSGKRPFCGVALEVDRESLNISIGMSLRYVPKGEDLNKFSANDLQKIQRSLNGRPRKTIGYKVPEGELTELVALSTRNRPAGTQRTSILSRPLSRRGQIPKSALRSGRITIWTLLALHFPLMKLLKASE